MKWKQEEEGCRKKEKKHVAIKSEDKKRNSLPCSSDKLNNFFSLHIMSLFSSLLK